MKEITNQKYKIGNRKLKITMIEVGMGDIAVAKGNDYLVAIGIGSCLVLTLYDHKQRIGALAHTMLPSRASSRIENRDTKYIDVAIDEMLKRMEARGSKREDLEAKLIGGANMFSAFKSGIGEENIFSAKENLKKAGIPIVGECVGGSQGRSVEFSVGSGIVTVKTKF